jgi:hypothetical protein
MRVIEAAKNYVEQFLPDSQLIGYGVTATRIDATNAETFGGPDMSRLPPIWWKVTANSSTKNGTIRWEVGLTDAKWLYVDLDGKLARINLQC